MIVEVTKLNKENYNKEMKQSHSETKRNIVDIIRINVK